MKVLVVDEEPPYPPDSGKKIRTWNLLKELARRHELTIVCYADAASPALEELRRVGIRVVPVRPRHFESGPILYAKLARNLLSREPFSVRKHARRRFNETVARLVRTEEFDLLHCEWTPYAAFALKNSRRGAKALPVVVATHNIEADIWRRRAKNQTSSLARTFFGLQAQKMERFERGVFAHADVVTAVSEGDERRAREWGARNTGVVANGVATDVITPSASDAVDAKELLFLGSLDWFPNVDAIRHFVEEIFPLIRQLDGAIRLNVVGRRPDAGLRELVKTVDGIDLTGEVDDVLPYLRRAGAVVVPLRIGGGTRIKILEAMAAGTVVVSTTIGAEGLAVKDGVHLLIADTPQDFAAASVKALDRSVAAAIAPRARALVEEQYSWRLQAEILERYWAAAVSAKR